MTRSLIILTTALLAMSCANEESNFTMSDDYIPVVASKSSSQVSETIEDDAVEKSDIEKKIIKDGRLGIRVSDLEPSKIRVDSLVKIHKGYYAQEKLNNTEWESSYKLRIRIPSSHFEKFIAGVESGTGEILYKEVAARDVTSEFIDLDARLENKRNYLERYRDLLKKAKNIKEILEVEEKIRVLEEEIESTTGRLKYLSNQVNFSTLNLEIVKKKEYKYSTEDRAKFLERLKNSLSKGWYGFVDFLLFLIRIWPFWILCPLFVYLLRKYRRRRKQLAEKE